MSDLADVIFSTLGCKGHTLGQMKVPVLFEGQVCLVGILQFLVPLHELDGDVRGVETTHVTDQDIFLAEFSWIMAVHLNLGWCYGQMKRELESVRIFRAFQCTKLCFNKQISLGLHKKSNLIFDLFWSHFNFIHIASVTIINYTIISKNLVNKSLQRQKLQICLFSTLFWNKKGNCAILSPLLLSQVFCGLFLSKLRGSQRYSGDASGGRYHWREIESKPGRL